MGIGKLGGPALGGLLESIDISLNQSLQSANNMLIPLIAAAIYFKSPGMLYAIAALFVLAAVVTYANLSQAGVAYHSKKMI